MTWTRMRILKKRLDEYDEEPSTFTVKVDGKEVEVDLDELKRGYSGQAYINQSMQKVAETRKEAEEIMCPSAMAQVQQALQLPQDGTLSTPPSARRVTIPDRPHGIHGAEAGIRQPSERAPASLNYLQQHVQATQETSRQPAAYLTKEAELLKGFHPELFVEEKGKEMKSGLVSTAAEADGFQPESLQRYGSPRPRADGRSRVPAAELRVSRRRSSRKFRTRLCALRSAR